MYIGDHVKCLLFLFDFNQKYKVLTNFNKKIQIQIFTQICSMGIMLFHADRWVDIYEASSHYSFCETHPKYADKLANSKCRSKQTHSNYSFEFLQCVTNSWLKDYKRHF